MTAIRSSLARHVPSAPDDQSIEAFKRQVWHEHGTVVIRLDDVRDEWLRRGLQNLAEQRYGRRGHGR